MKTHDDRRGAVWLVGVIAFALVLSACGGQDGATGDSDAATGDETDASSDEGVAAGDGEVTSVTLGTTSDLTTLDSGKQSGWHETYPLDNVYDGLTRRADDGSVEPALATAWEISDDGLEWTIQIREGVKFHNGEDMTAEDVAYTISRYADPDWPGQQGSITYGNVVSAEATDDFTVVVTTSEREPLFIHISSFYSTIVPKSVAETMSYDEWGQTPETAIGTGPYMVKEWVRDDRLVLEAFEDHWRGAPAIDEVIFRPIPDAGAATAALRSGDIDIMESLPVEQVALIGDNPDLDVRTSFGTARTRLIMNSNREPFDSREVRLAVNFAVDPQRIIDTVLEGIGDPIALYGIPGTEIGAHPDLPLYPYDPEQARDLLEQAGYPDGFEVDFLVRGGEQKAEEIAQVIASQLSEVGIETNIRVVNNSDFSRFSEEKDISLAFSGHGGGAAFHINQGFTSLFHCERGTAVHRGFYCNPEVEALLDEAMDTLHLDEDAAMESYFRAQELCYEDACMGGLWAEPFIFGVNSALNWVPPASGAMWMYDASW